MKKINKKIKILFLLIPIILISSLFIWANDYYKAMPYALDVLASSGGTITKDYIMIGNDSTSENAIIFYPGGKVDYKAYVPLANELSKNGTLVYIVKMPLNLAVLSPNKGSKIINSNSLVKNWYIAGHSLGGAMAATFAYDNEEKLKGIIFLAAYPAKNKSLSNSSLRVLSLFGEKDGLATEEKIENTKVLLPSNTIYVKIDGGNHAQMGYYGSQKGDNVASISREVQQSILVNKISEFIK